MNRQYYSVQNQWGDSNLTLNLPFAQVVLTGLNKTQQSALSHTYQHYIGYRQEATRADTNKNTRETELYCDIVRLSEPPNIPMSEMADGNIYTLKKVRKNNVIEFTGVGFVGVLNLDSSPVRSSLGVFEEEKICEGDALENFLRPFSALYALKKGGLVLHSAGFVVDDNAWIFIGRSGAGKNYINPKSTSRRSNNTQ